MTALDEADCSGALKHFHSSKNRTVIRHCAVGRTFSVGATDLPPTNVFRMKSERLKAKGKQQVEVKDAQCVERHFLMKLARNVQPNESECSVVGIECLVVGELGHGWTALWCHLMKHCSASQ